jgi:hypothetical protein
MRLRRLALASALLLAGLATAGAAERAMVIGTLTYDNFPKLEAYLRKAGSEQIMLALNMAVDNDETDGHMTTFVLDGQFEIAHLRPGKPVRIYSDSGELDDSQEHYLLEGIFTVEQGDDSLGLTFIDAPPGGVSDVIEIDDLPAGTGN